jgi:hypothetical protein
MSKEFFSEIFRLFAEYEHDLTIYCHNDMTHNWECEMPDKKKLSDSDKQLLKRIVKVLGVNYNSKLAKLYHAFESFVETGEGTIKIKMPDGVIEMVPIKTLVGGGGFLDALLGSKKKRTPEQQAAHNAKKLSRTPAQQAARDAKKKKLSYKLKKIAKHTARNVGTAVEMAQQASDALLEQSDEPVRDPVTGELKPRQKRTSPLVSLFGSTDIIRKLQKIMNEIDDITSGTFDAQRILGKPVVKTLVNGINAPTLNEIVKINEKLDLIIGMIRDQAPEGYSPPVPERSLRRSLTPQERRLASDVEALAEPEVIA